MPVSRTSLRPLLSLPLIVALLGPLPMVASSAADAADARLVAAAAATTTVAPAQAKAQKGTTPPAAAKAGVAAKAGAAATPPAGEPGAKAPAAEGTRTKRSTAAAAKASVPVPTPVATPRIVPFEDWAPTACPRPTGDDAAPLRRTVVHHTHEPVARTPDEVVPALALTCAAHVGRGFSTIGYHYVVDPWGGIWQGRGGMPGKDGSAPRKHGEGAHVAGSNGGAVGVVFLGDHAAAPPTAAALEAATGLLAWLHTGAGIDPVAEVRSSSTGGGTAKFAGAFRIAGLAGHSDSNNTECPGEHLRALLGDLRTRVRQVMAGQQPASWDALAAPAAAGEAVAEAPAAAQAAPDAAPADQASAATVVPAPALPGATMAAPAAPPVRAVDDALPAKASAKPAAAITAARPGPVALPHQVSASGLRQVGLTALADRFDPATS